MAPAACPTELTVAPCRMFMTRTSPSNGVHRGDGALRDPGVAHDSVTERGARHLQELIRAIESGHRAVLLFCVSRSDALSTEPARDIDPNYANWLARAHEAGVEVLAYKCRITQRGVWLHRRLPVHVGSAR